MTDKTFVCHYRGDDGAKYGFLLVLAADGIPDAELALERITISGAIDGELVEQGEAPLPFQVGHA